MKKIKIDIFNYHQQIFSNEVLSISLKDYWVGEMTVLSKHIPVITSIEKSEIILKLNAQKTKTFWIGKGIFYFHNNQAKLIASQIEEKNSLKK